MPATMRAGASEMRPKSRSLLLVATLLAVAPVAVAQAPDPQKVQAAADEFDEGTRLFKRKEYEDAAAHFESADRFAPSPAAVGNAIRARYAAKQYARAATLALQATARYPDDKGVAEVAQKALKGADANLHRIDVACDPACTLLVDGKVASADEVASYSMYVDPGKHALVAGWSGDRSKTTQIDASKGGTQKLDLKAPPEPKKAAPPPSASAAPLASASSTTPPPVEEEAKPIPSWVTLSGVGLTVVLAGVSIWSGLDTKANPGPDAVRAACQRHDPSCNTLFDEGKSKETRTNVLFGVTAGVGVLTGVAAAFFTDWSGPATKPNETGRIRPTLDVTHGVSIGAAGVF